MWIASARSRAVHRAHDSCYSGTSPDLNFSDEEIAHARAHQMRSFLFRAKWEALGHWCRPFLHHVHRLPGVKLVERILNENICRNQDASYANFAPTRHKRAVKPQFFLLGGAPVCHPFLREAVAVRILT